MASQSRRLASSPVLGSPPPDLSGLPPILLLQTRAPPGYMDDFAASLRKCNATVTEIAQEATLFVGFLNTKKRAQFELRQAGVPTVEDDPALDSPNLNGKKRALQGDPKISPKRPKHVSNGATKTTSDSSTEDSDMNADCSSEPDQSVFPWHAEPSSERSFVYVLRLAWLQDSLAKDLLLPPAEYMVYRGKTIDYPGEDHREPSSMVATTQMSNMSGVTAEPDNLDDIMRRAKEDAPTAAASTRFSSAPYGRRRFRDQQHGKLGMPEPRPKLMDLHTASFDESLDQEVPPTPDWVKNNKKYACERPTLQHSPNDEFIGLLMKIRLARLLTGDEIGVRAYSSSIAAIAAVTTKFVHPKEIVRLPACDVKIANLWVEYKNTGTIEAAKEVDTDDTLRILNDFYDIWGVGEKTAREFYYDRGWRDRDDVLEYGWHDLTRVQQIGLKYYDEFQLGIPRDEVEFILSKVKEHAIKVRDDGIEAIVVGGYRRGKAESGDVDIVLSHRQLSETANLVTDIVASLEDEGWITHTLSLHLTGTKRGQATLPFKSVDKQPGTGFDTLDKALVVWQDINWPTKVSDKQRNTGAKNPNVHRRVDIIITPWRTAGCAVLGWSGGTTFQRDIRRYAKYVKQWKFDSSGIRSRVTGEVLQLEGERGVDGDMVDAEKAVFAGLQLEYREPEERWTR